MRSVTNEQEFNRQQEELEKDLDSKIDADDLPAANIMVAGITGTGKSTLINAIFGSEMAATGMGTPVTDHISEYGDKDIPVHIWDTVGLELDAEKTKQSIKAIKDTIASKVSSENPYDRVHAIWYCINSGSRKYQGVELEFIKELYDIGVPFIIVLTQCSGDEDEVNAFESKIKEINASKDMKDIKIVQVLALPVKYRGGGISIPAFGLDDLVNVTLEFLPEFIKNGFVAAQKVSQNEKRNACEEVICSYVRAAQNGFWDKVPYVNIITTDKKIMKMFRKIGEIYNTVLSVESIEEIIKNSRVDFFNNYFGLVFPDIGYGRKIKVLLERKKEEGFAVNVADVGRRDRAARMIAFYGYTFVEAIEILWKNLTQEQLNNVDMVVRELVGIINQKLRERKRR